jgi:uncharacterized protein (TIGR03084 family)
MTLSEAADFGAESEALFDVLAGLGDEAFKTPTQFKGWTIEEVLIHLHFWNLAADLSARDEPAFQALIGRVLPAISGRGFREIENEEVGPRGTALRDIWHENAQAMAQRWSTMDPKTRLPWAGPSMSARSSMTARQMETWAHGSEIFDVLGQPRPQTDRIKNIVVLGVNTFAWSHQVQGLPVPEKMPRLTLTLPSGTVFEAGEEDAGRIVGPAVDFAAVVTQTRAFADTDLVAEGPVALGWMSTAQCFAGGAETPPRPGSRYVAKAATC